MCIAIRLENCILVVFFFYFNSFCRVYYSYIYTEYLLCVCICIKVAVWFMSSSSSSASLNHLFRCLTLLLLLLTTNTFREIEHNHLISMGLMSIENYFSQCLLASCAFVLLSSSQMLSRRVVALRGSILTARKPRAILIEAETLSAPFLGRMSTEAVTLCVVTLQVNEPFSTGRKVWRFHHQRRFQALPWYVRRVSILAPKAYEKSLWNRPSKNWDK